MEVILTMVFEDEGENTNAHTLLHALAEKYKASPPDPEDAHFFHGRVFTEAQRAERERRLQEAMAAGTCHLATNYKP